MKRDNEEDGLNREDVNKEFKELWEEQGSEGMQGRLQTVRPLSVSLVGLICARSQFAERAPPRSFFIFFKQNHYPS